VIPFEVSRRAGSLIIGPPGRAGLPCDEFSDFPAGKGRPRAAPMLSDYPIHSITEVRKNKAARRPAWSRTDAARNTTGAPVATTCRIGTTEEACPDHRGNGGRAAGARWLLP